MEPWWAFVGDCCASGNALVMCLIGCYFGKACLLTCISSRAGSSVLGELLRAMTALLLRDLFIEAFLWPN